LINAGCPTGRRDSSVSFWALLGRRGRLSLDSGIDSMSIIGNIVRVYPHLYVLDCVGTKQIAQLISPLDNEDE